MSPNENKRVRYPNVTIEDIALAISAQPGITAQELAELSTLPLSTVYNRVAKLRTMMRIKTVMDGSISRYYPFTFVITKVPGLEKPATPLHMGEEVINIRTLTPEDLEALSSKPVRQTKYTELLGYVDRLNPGEAAVFDSEDMQLHNIRGPIKHYFKDTKKFKIVRNGKFVIIERTQ